jgi:hypothetical protein
MAGLTATPQRYGAALSVADEAALTALSVDGLTAGTAVWRADTETYWILTPGGSGVAASGATGIEWVEQTGGGGGTVVTDSTLTGDGSIGDPLHVVGSGWYTTEAAAHLALIPQLTESVPIQVGVSNEAAILSVSLIDASKEGGALRGSASTWGVLVKGSVYQNLSTSKFALSFQCSCATIAVSQASYFGLYDIVSGAALLFGTAQADHATQFTGWGYNASLLTAKAALGAADTAVHTWRMVSDGTTVTWYRDGVSVGTLLTAATNFPTQKASPALQATAGSSGSALYKVLYSFVGP